MNWVTAFGLAIASLCVMALLGKPGRRGLAASGAALMAGLAGYATQASPQLAGAPHPQAEGGLVDPAALVDARKAFSHDPALPGDRWLLIGDALARHGQFAESAGVLLGAVEKDPNNGEAWLALANALAGHAGGRLTPASLYAYRRAAQAAPDDPRPPYFLGVALAQSGRPGEAQRIWFSLLARAPGDAPWRAGLVERLAALNAPEAKQTRPGPAN